MCRKSQRTIHFNALPLSHFCLFVCSVSLLLSSSYNSLVLGTSIFSHLYKQLDRVSAAQLARRIVKSYFINDENWTDFPIAIDRLGSIFIGKSSKSFRKEDYSFDVITVQYYKPMGITFRPLPLSSTFCDYCRYPAIVHPVHSILLGTFISCSRDD